MRLSRVIEAFHAKDPYALARIARQFGHNIKSASSHEISTFRSEIARLKRDDLDPYTKGYLDALLEIAAAHQIEVEEAATKLENIYDPEEG